MKSSDETTKKNDWLFLHVSLEKKVIQCSYKYSAKVEQCVYGPSVLEDVP